MVIKFILKYKVKDKKKHNVKLFVLYQEKLEIKKLLEQQILYQVKISIYLHQLIKDSLHLMLDQRKLINHG